MATAQDGNLSCAKQDEMDGYINVSHFIAFVQLKARTSLKIASLYPSLHHADLL